MKMRLNGNSLRLRLLRSEVAAFVESGRIEEKVHFASGGQAYLIYALEHEAGIPNVLVRSEPSRVTIVLPEQQATSWARTEQIGIYSAIDLGQEGSLSIIIEKDFACLDLSDADNHDTFPNPQIGAAC